MATITGTPESGYLTPEELAETLRVSVWTVRRECAKGTIPGVIRLGAQWRINRAVFESAQK